MSDQPSDKAEMPDQLFVEPLSGMALDRAIDEQVMGNTEGQYLTPYHLTMGRAWRVVEHLRAKGWSFTLRDCGDGWHAEFHRPGCRVGQGGDSAPEAICRAGLGTVGPDA